METHGASPLIRGGDADIKAGARSRGRTGFVRILLAALSIGCVACSHARTYPICLYDTALGAVKEAEEAWPSLEARLTDVASLVAGSRENVVVVNSRAAVVKTTKGQDKRLRAIWPSIACFGQSGGTASGELLRACVEYVRSYISNEGESLPSQVLVPPCQTLPAQVIRTPN